MTKLPVVLFAGSLALASCESKDSKPAESTKPVGETVTTPAVVNPTPTPVAVAYSPEAAAKLLAAADTCVVYLACDSYKPLVAFGAPVAPELVKVAADKAAKVSVRELAAHAIIDIGAPEGGEALYAAAKAEDNITLKLTLFEAAGATKTDAVFEAAKKDLFSKDKKVGLSEVLATLRPFGVKALTWAADGLETAKAGPEQYRYAAVIRDTATAAELPVVVELLAKTKDVMAKQHLASTAVKLGDASHLEVLYAGLSSKDEYERADAGNMLADVVDQVPDADRAKVIDLVSAAKAKDKGGLTSMGYDRILKKLGGK